MSTPTTPSGKMSRPRYCEVHMTVRQAKFAAEAMWRMEQRLEQYAEIGHIQDGTTVKDRLALAELRRKLHLVSLRENRE